MKILPCLFIILIDIVALAQLPPYVRNPITTNGPVQMTNTILGVVGVIPTRFVDSISGSDLNDGSQAKPWATLAKAIAFSTNNICIGLARGSVWYESLILGTNAHVFSYGGGQRPLIDCSVEITNLVPVALTTNTFTATVPLTANTPQLIENGWQLIQVTNTAASGDYTPGTWYLSGATAYIHPRGFTTNAAFRAAARNYSVYVGKDSSIVGVHALNGGGNNGAIEARERAYVRDCISENGTKHNFLITSGTVEDCIALNASYYEGGTMFVTHGDTTAERIVYRRCSALSTRGVMTNISGFYGHGGGASYASALYEDCDAQYCLKFGGMNNCSITAFNRCRSIGCFQGWTGYTGKNLFVQCDLIENKNVTAQNAFAFLASTNWIIQCRASFPGGGGVGYAVRMDTGPGAIYATDNHFYCDGAAALYGFGTVALANSFIGATNNVLSGTWTAIFNPAEAATTAQDGNVTNGVSLVSSPAYGDFTYSQTSQAVTNQAGPGWRMPVIPSDFSGIDVTVQQYSFPLTGNGSALGDALTNNYSATATFLGDLNVSGKLYTSNWFRPGGPIYFLTNGVHDIGDPGGFQPRSIYASGVMNAATLMSRTNGVWFGYAIGAGLSARITHVGDGKILLWNGAANNFDTLSFGGYIGTSFPGLKVSGAGLKVVGGNGTGSVSNSLTVSGSITVSNGYYFPTNAMAVWPSSAKSPGESVIVNSNGYMFMLESHPGATAWVSTNPVSHQPKWVDVAVSGTEVRLGASSPQRTLIMENIYGQGWDATDDADFTMQFQHGVARTNAWLPNFYFIPHLHLSVIATNAGNNVAFKMSYQYAKEGEAFSPVYNVTNWVVFTQTNTMEILEMTPHTNNALSGADSLIIRGNIRCLTNSTGARAILDSADFHVPITQYGNYGY